MSNAKLNFCTLRGQKLPSLNHILTGGIRLYITCIVKIMFTLIEALG